MVEKQVVRLAYARGRMIHQKRSCKSKLKSYSPNLYWDIYNWKRRNQNLAKFLIKYERFTTFCSIFKILIFHWDIKSFLNRIFSKKNPILTKYRCYRTSSIIYNRNVKKYHVDAQVILQIQINVHDAHPKIDGKVNACSLLLAQHLRACHASN